MIQMASVVPDTWRFAELLTKEFDDISQIFPAFEGKAGTATSGYQTNLLQEASDTVHSPDARGYELAIRDALYKFRRMMRTGYTVERMISFSGRSKIPEVFEFSSDNIDEHAIIRVQVGSGLSQFKAARIQQLMEFRKEGLLGDPNDPEVKRRVLSLIDLGGVEEFQERAAMDEDLARSENLDILDGKDIPVPQFYEDHMSHYQAHTDELKSPANKDMPAETRLKLMAHTILHVNWMNPQAAYDLAMKTNLMELVQQGLIQPPPPPMMGGPQPGQPGQGGPPQPGGQPNQGPPPQPGGPTPTPQQ
jgi:hypothetical protein